jgi:hypothetical protein
MNNLLKVLKSSQYFLYIRRWFKKKEKILLKFMLASMKTLTNSGDFTVLEFLNYQCGPGTD